MENSTDSRTGRLRYIYSTLSMFLELEKLSEMPEKVISPGILGLEAFSTHVIPYIERLPTLRSMDPPLMMRMFSGCLLAVNVNPPRNFRNVDWR